MNKTQTTNHKLQTTRGFTHAPILALFRFCKKRLSKSGVFTKALNMFLFGGETKKVTPNLVSGFTLIETLVAIFVMLTAIIAPMSIASQALSSARYAKEQVTAFYLAQEGIELVRNTRDNNVIAAGTWNEESLGSSATGSETVCYAPAGCIIDAKDLTVSACTNSCLPINIDSNGIYTHSALGSLPTQFTRTIKIKKIGANEISVFSAVSWMSSTVSGVRTFTITDNLLSWP